MIRGGIGTGDVEAYLVARAWLQDAARLLRRNPEELAEELVRAMTDSGAVVVRDGLLLASAEHSSVAQESLWIPFPCEWE